MNRHWFRWHAGTSLQAILGFLIPKGGIKTTKADAGEIVRTCDQAITIINGLQVTYVDHHQNQMKQHIGGLEDSIRKLTHTLEKSVAPSFPSYETSNRVFILYMGKYNHRRPYL
ncbi:hypothetical protein ACJX0J_012193, partial [Zea mays]